MMEKLSFKEIENLFLWMLKEEFDILEDKDNLDLIISIAEDVLSKIEKELKKYVILDYKKQDFLKNLPSYIDIIRKDESLEKINLKYLKDFSIQIRKLNSYKKKVDFLKTFLEIENRIKYSRKEFLTKISQDFSDLDIDVNNSYKKIKHNSDDILEIPFSDINLEGHSFFNKDINKALEKIQKIIERAIEIQISSNYQYKTINLIFLGNIINRSLILEQDFQESLINYNLSFEFSIFLIKINDLLKKYFNNVNNVFSLEQSNFREKELSNEHFRNYNINFDRIIPYLIKNFYNNRDINLIQIGMPSEDAFYSIMQYNSWTIVISYWNIKNSNLNKINFNLLEKEILKKYINTDIKRISKFYIW